MAKSWRTDDELLALARNELFSAVVGDVMDQLGLLHQFLPPRIRPLRSDMRVAGRAMPVLVEDLPEDGAAAGADPPFGLMLDALDDLGRNEVYVCVGGSPRYALWGELMSARATRLEAAGAVLAGYYRDTAGIAALGFATFGYGAYAQDQGARGKVVDFRSRIEIVEVAVEPGDLVFGDQDGVCVIPRQSEEEVFVRALEKARGEQTVRREIEAGMSSREAFAKYGIL